MILGLLSERGPMHGHARRRTSELTNAETWGDLAAGALYGELRRLAAEGLIRTLRTEQVGRHPTRTVYEIAEEGRLELTVQREAALDQIPVGPDAITVALFFANGGRLGDLRRRLGERRAKVGQLEAMQTERRRLEEQGILGLLEVGAFRRGEYRLEAELIWQSEFDRPVERRRSAAPRSGGAGPASKPGAGVVSRSPRSAHAAAGRLVAVDLIACLLLLVQYVLGLVTNLFVTLPAQRRGADSPTTSAAWSRRRGRELALRVALG